MSWIKVMFNPKKSAENLAEWKEAFDKMNLYADELEQNHSVLQEMFDNLSNENDALKKQITDTEKTVENLLAQLAKTRSERDKYLADLHRSDQQLKQLDDILIMVEQFESLKNNYDNKITKLKNRIEYLEEALSIATAEKQSAPEITPIDFDNLHHAIDNTSKKSVTSSPQSDFATQKKQIASPTPSLFDSPDNIDNHNNTSNPETANDDWLRPLPDILI